MDTVGAVTVPAIVAANHQATPSAINVNHPINSIPPHHHHHHTTANARNILTTIAHGNTNTNTNSASNSSNVNTHINNNSLINNSSSSSSSLIINNSNSSSSSSSSSSASSGYGSTSATPTNSYETHTAATTPVAIAEPPVIPIATVAAVSPYYSESLTTQAVEGQHYVQQQQQHPHQHQQHQQQRQSLHHLNALQHQQPQAQTHQHQLQQNLQHSQRQQYYTSTYDYQQQQQVLQSLPPPPPPPIATASSLHQQQTVHQQQPQPQPHSQSHHSLALTYNMGSGSAAIDCTSVNSSSAASATSAAYQAAGHYKHLDASSISYERPHVARPQAGAVAPTLNYPQHQIPNDSQSSKHLTQSHAQQQQQFLNAPTATTTISNSGSSKSRSASSLLGSLSSSSSSSTASSTATTKPQAAATPFYAQPLAQQSQTNSSAFYDNLKHKMPHDYHDNFVNFPNAAAYHQQQKYYAAAKSQLKDASSYGSPPGLASKSMFPNANSYYAGATGQHATGGYDKYIYPTSYPSLAYESPPDPAYRKGNTTGSLNSHSWPWGIDYASGNSRTIPPPTGHIPTATVAPTHASYLTANAPHLARDPYYMAHDKYGMKYDKYPPPYQQTYVSPPGARHHLWPPASHTALSERLPPPPHTLHSSAYYPANAPPPSSLNARQTCCTQPYQPQNCYYPPTRLPPHASGQASAMGQTAAYLANSGQPTANTHQPHLSPLSSSCKYGSVIDYGAANKLKNPNDLYLGAAHYDSNAAPPPHHAYNYGTTSTNVANQLYNTNQLHHGAQPAGPLITHESLVVSTPNFTNDLSLNTNTYDSYNHHHHQQHHHNDPNHMNPQGLGMTSNGPTVPGYAQVNNNNKRALLDYRKPIQTQPTQQQPAPQQQVPSYGQTQNAAAAALHHYQSTDLLNTPETTTTFAEYDAQAQAIGYTAAEIPETVDPSGKSNDEATKNLSLRDFIANWNDDEDECAANEDPTFDQSLVINEVLSAGAVAEPILASDQVQVAMPVPIPVPVQMLESSLKPMQVPVAPEEKAKSPLDINKNTETIPKSAVTPTPTSIPADTESSQYVNLPDIVIDIEKSNVPTTIATPPTDASLVLDEFDVEKELDQLQMKKNVTDSIIAKPSHDIKSVKDCKQDIIPKSKNAKDLVKVPPIDSDHIQNLEQNKAVSATGPHPTEHTNAANAATPTEQTLRDMEGYDSGSSRHSNESSLFEKEYETFINKITTIAPKSKSECEIEENVKEFSKFYKRKRKLRDEEVKTMESTDKDGKRLKSSEAEKAKNSNFPQVYTKKSRNRHLSVAQWIKNHPKRKWKPLSIYYKLIHSLRRYRRYRSKKAREFIAELKEKHLPLIKRRSIKNYTIAGNSDVLPLFNPESLKSLVLTVINSERFRDRLLNIPLDVCIESEQKHICTDPLCETCDVIRSLMEPEGFDSIIGEQNIVYDSTDIVDMSNGTKLIYLEEQREEFTAIKQTESFGSQEFQLQPGEVLLGIESDSKPEPMDRLQDGYRDEQTSSAVQEMNDGIESSFAQTPLIVSHTIDSYRKDNVNMAVENLSILGNKPQITSCIRIAPLNIIDLDTIPDDVQNRRDCDIMMTPEVNPPIAPSVIKATATELSDAIKEDSDSPNIIDETTSLSDIIPKIHSSDVISQLSSVIQKAPVISTEGESLAEIPELNIATNNSTTNLDADALITTEFEKNGEKRATISNVITSDSETPQKASFDNKENTENIVKIEKVSDSESESDSESGSSECDSDCSCSSCTSSDSSDEDEKDAAQPRSSTSVNKAKEDLQDASLTRRESFKRKTSNDDPESYPAYLKKPKSEVEETSIDMKSTCTQPEIEKKISKEAIETKDILDEHKDVSRQSQSSAQQSCNVNVVEITADSDSETDSSSSEENSDYDTDLSQSENESDIKSSSRNDYCARESNAVNDSQKLEGDMKERRAESEAQKLEGDMRESQAESEAQKLERDVRESHAESEAQKLEGDMRESHAENGTQKLERDARVNHAENELQKLEGDARESHAESKAQKLEDDRGCNADDHPPTVKCESIETNVLTEMTETNSTKQILTDSENLTPNDNLSEKVIKFIGNHILPESTQSATITTNLINETSSSYAKSDDKRHDLEEEEVATHVQEKPDHQPFEEDEKHNETNTPKDLSTSQSFQDINVENVATENPRPTLTDIETPPSNLFERHNVEPIDYSKSREEKKSEAIDTKKRESINIAEDSSLSNNSQNNISQSAPARPRIILSIKRTPEVVESTKDTTSYSEKDAEKYHYTTKLKSVDFTNDLHAESQSSYGSEGFESENEDGPACVEIYNEDVINSFASKSNSKLFAGTFAKESSLSSRDFNAFNLSEIDEKMGDLFPHTSFGRVSRTFDIPEDSLLSNKSDVCINLEEKELRRSFECLQSTKESPSQKSPNQNGINLEDLEKEENVGSAVNSPNSTDVCKKSNEFVSEPTGSPPKNIDEEYGNPWTPAEVNDILKFPTPVRNFPEDSTSASHVAYLSMNTNSPLTLRKDEKLSELNSYGSDTFDNIHFQNFASKDQTLTQPKEGQSKTFPVAFGDNDAFMHDSSASSTSSSEELILNSSLVEVRNDTETPQGSMGNRVSVISFSHSNTETSDVTSQKEGLSRMICNTTYIDSMTSSLEHSVVDESSMTNSSEGALKQNEENEAEKEAYDLKQFNFHSIFGNIEKLVAPEGELSNELQENLNVSDNSLKCKEVSEALLEPTLSVKETYSDAKLEDNKSLEENVTTNKEIETPQQTLDPKGVIVSPDSPESLCSQVLQLENKTNPQCQASNDTNEYKTIMENTVANVLKPDFVPHQDVSILHPITPNTLICDLVDAFVESASTLMEEKYEQVAETLTTEECLPSPSAIESDGNENQDANTTEVPEELLPNIEVEMTEVLVPEALETEQCLPLSDKNGETPASEVQDEYPLEKAVVKDCDSEEISFISNLKKPEECLTDSQQTVNLITTTTADEESIVSANNEDIQQYAKSLSPTEINLSEEEKAIDRLNASIDIKSESGQALSASCPNETEKTKAEDREISEEIQESLEDNKVRSFNDLSADNEALLQSPTPVGVEQPQVSGMRAPQEYLEEDSIPNCSLISSPKCHLDSNEVKESSQDNLNEIQFEKPNFSVESTSLKDENLQKDQLEKLNIPVQGPSTFESTAEDEMEIPEGFENSKNVELSSRTLSSVEAMESEVHKDAAEEECKYDEEQEPGKLPNCSKNTFGYEETNETQQKQVDEKTNSEQPLATLSPRETISLRDIESKTDNNFVSEEPEIGIPVPKSNKDIEEVNKEFNKQEEASVGDLKEEKSTTNSNCYEIAKLKDNATETIAYSEDTRSDRILNPEEKPNTLSAKDDDNIISEDCSNVNKSLNNENSPPSSETGNNFPDSKDCSKVIETVCKNIKDPHSKADDIIDEQPVYPRFGRFKSYLSKKLESHNENKTMEKSKSLSNSQASSPKAVSPNWNEQPINSERLAEELLEDSHPKSCEIVTDAETINEYPKLNDDKVCPIQDDKPAGDMDSLSNQMEIRDSLSSNKLESLDDEFDGFTVDKTQLDISVESTEEHRETNALEDSPKGHCEDSLNSRSSVRPEVFPDVADELANSTSLDKISVPDDVSSQFLGFRNQLSFEDESDDFHGFEDQHEEDRIRREIESLNEDSAANDAFPCVSAMNKKTPSDSGSISSDLNELEALEKALSQHRLISECDGPSEADEENAETSKKLVSVANISISTNDIEHIKQMLESDEEHNDNENETQITRTKDDINLSHTCKIPKLSDLCRAALNSSLIVSKMTTVQSSPRGISLNNDLSEETTITTGTGTSTSSNSASSSLSNTMNALVIERELSVEEALADMYRQAGVLLSDPEDTDNEKSLTNEEAQDVLLINLQEILNSDNDNGFVLQCDMNLNVQENINENHLHVKSDNAYEIHSPREANNTTERVGTVQLIGFLNTSLETPEIHIISSDSESEVIILSDCDTDVEFSFSPQLPPPPPPPSVATKTAIDTSREYIPFIDDLKTNDDSQSDIWTIHHEEIVPDNLNKYLKEEFYRYLHEKYAQKKLSKYYHANRILRKYKKRLTNKCWQLN